MDARFLLVALLAAAPFAAAHDGDDPHAGHALGRVSFPVSCSTRAQGQFEHALLLLHHMTYPQARAEFRALAAAEPECAMADWGVAMTLFQPLWPTRPGPAELAAGRAAVAAARAARPRTERERRFVDAVAAFYDDAGAPNYPQRLARWEDASRAVHEAYPDDPEASVFYALAHLAVAPPDARARDYADEAAALLLPVYRANPDHPGAMHYLVHANDVPGRERELLEVVRRYEEIAPRNPHALHMPTHIYTRLGSWPDVVRGNLRAADAALEHPAGDHGQYVWDEFPHAIEYLVYALLQQGRDAEAERQSARLHATANLEPTFKTAFHLASTSARLALERDDWAAAAALPVRTPAALDWDRYPWPEAVTWFARALGQARTGHAAEAAPALDRLAALEKAAASSGETLFERTIRVLRLDAEGWTLQAEGREKDARARLVEAARLERATPKHAVTPAPTLPAEELLGDLLAEQRHPAEALEAYRRALEAYPGRFRSLLGAARSAAALGDRAAAREYYGRLRDGAPDSVRDDAEIRAGAAP